MINRYAIAAKPEELKKAFQLEEIPNLEPIYNAFPTRSLPVIVQNNQNKVDFFIWGLMAKWSNNKEMSPRLFNVSLSDVITKRTYRSSFLNRRCIIPASGFYLWKKVAKKKSIPYYFYKEQASSFAVAGIWEEGDEFSDKQIPNFMMITDEANEGFSEYQEDFPLILSNEQVKNWLDPAYDVEQNIDSIPSRNWNFTVHPVSPLISNTKNDFKKLIEPSKPTDQHGNYTLFG